MTVEPAANELELTGRLEFYQKLLRLRDWSVTIEHAAAAVLGRAGDGSDALGLCNHSLGTKTAVIQILETLPGLDAEAVIVHELLHLHFAPFQADVDGSQEDTAQEQAINLIAEALVTLRRSQ